MKEDLFNFAAHKNDDDKIPAERMAELQSHAAFVEFVTNLPYLTIIDKIKLIEDEVVNNPSAFRRFKGPANPYAKKTPNKPGLGLR